MTTQTLATYDQSGVKSGRVIRPAGKKNIVTRCGTTKVKKVTEILVICPVQRKGQHATKLDRNFLDY